MSDELKPCPFCNGSPTRGGGFGGDPDVIECGTCTARVESTARRSADEIWNSRQGVRGEPIRVWEFYDAPPELQALSQHGGDEDWLAVVPPHLAESYIGWMQTGSQFGVCSVTEHDHPTKPNYRVYIGAHA